MNAGLMNGRNESMSMDMHASAGCLEPFDAPSTDDISSELPVRVASAIRAASAKRRDTASCRRCSRTSAWRASNSRQYSCDDLPAMLSAMRSLRRIAISRVCRWAISDVGCGRGKRAGNSLPRRPLPCKTLKTANTYMKTSIQALEEDETLPALVSAALQCLTLLTPLNCNFEAFELGRRTTASANRLATVLSRTYPMQPNPRCICVDFWKSSHRIGHSIHVLQ